ncbi:hypothetical protein C4A75_03850 [Brevibacillus laterosporus]|nr:hypothetical protein C4A75_03850 [Brevibacillus laterosporus]
MKATQEDRRVIDSAWGCVDKFDSTFKQIQLKNDEDFWWIPLEDVVRVGYEQNRYTKTPRLVNWINKQKSFPKRKRIRESSTLYFKILIEMTLEDSRLFLRSSYPFEFARLYDKHDSNLCSSCSLLFFHE